MLGNAGPINFQNTDHDIIISTTGVVSARDGSGTLSVQRGTLQMVDFDSPQQLQKDGASTFQAPPNANQKPIAPGTRVVQGSIEKSNVRPILEMTRMIEITRSIRHRGDPAAARRPAPELAAAARAGDLGLMVRIKDHACA